MLPAGTQRQFHGQGVRGKARQQWLRRRHHHEWRPPGAANQYRAAELTWRANNNRQLAGPARGKTFHIVSLGCTKNTVDSEAMAQFAGGRPRARRGRRLGGPGRGPTCGFIEPAKRIHRHPVELGDHKRAGWSRPAAWSSDTRTSCARSCRSSTVFSAREIGPPCLPWSNSSTCCARRVIRCRWCNWPSQARSTWRFCIGARAARARTSRSQMAATSAAPSAPSRS